MGLVKQDCSSSDSLFSRLGSEGCEEKIRQNTGVGATSRWDDEGLSGDYKEPREFRERNTRLKAANWPYKEIGLVAMHIIKTGREWGLIILCAILFLSNFFPYATELVYPILDTKGSNLMNMETDKIEYRCKELVQARAIFQKNRAVAGEVTWVLVPNSPRSRLEIYPSKVTTFSPGIYDIWLDVEKLPGKCEPGRYHFEGAITYPVWLGKVTYSLRTSCFDIIQ